MNDGMAVSQRWTELLTPKHLTAVIFTETKIKQTQKMKSLNIFWKLFPS